MLFFVSGTLHMLLETVSQSVTCVMYLDVILPQDKLLILLEISVSNIFHSMKIIAFRIIEIKWAHIQYQGSLIP